MRGSRGVPTLTKYLFLKKKMRGGERIQMKLKAGSDNGTTSNVGILMIFEGILRTFIAREPYSFVVFQGGGGSDLPDPCIDCRCQCHPVSKLMVLVPTLACHFEFHKCQMTNDCVNFCCSEK